jgi:thiamine-phosphate pyrophosphorylase
MRMGMDRRSRLARVILYVITGERGGVGETARIAERALSGGADVIQLRKKEMPWRDQFRLGLRLRELTAEYEALFIVNDHVDLAIVCDADGVHLGQQDLDPAVARSRPGFEGRLVGRSTHSLEQALRAVDQGVDYLGVGPVFATPTKPGRAPVGLGLVEAVSGAVRIPFVAIGGIDQTNAEAAFAAGAPAVAVVRAVWDAADPRVSAAGLRSIGAFRRQVAAR